MSEPIAEILQQVNALVDAYRDRCLWYLRKDYYPAGPDDAVRTLKSIQRHGDLEAFRKAGALLECLSPHTNNSSAVS